jgi:riboflavin synthase
MFTGLVEEVGQVRRLERRGEGGRLSVAARTVLEGTRIGDSIAVNGACLTVVEMDGQGFVVDCMPETLLRTTLGSASGGDRVNLERSLALGSRLGGHLVLGHVDAVAQIRSVVREGNAFRITMSLPPEIGSCVAPKGSIAIAGISLTVIDVTADRFSVGIIPHTLAETTLRDAKPGGRVNVEADVLARYVLRTLEVLATGRAQAGDSTTAAAGGGLEALLREQGFI